MFSSITNSPVTSSLSLQASPMLKLRDKNSSDSSIVRITVNKLLEKILILTNELNKQSNIIELLMKERDDLKRKLDFA